MPIANGGALESPMLGRRFTWKPGIADGATHAALDAKRAVEQKIVTGTYSFEDRACFCGSLDGGLLATRDRHGFYYPFVACKRCGLLRANPRMTEASYAQFYDQEYRAAYGEEDGRLEQYFESGLYRGQGVYDYVTNGLPTASRPKVIFEIGCNMGAMLVPWKNAGCEVHGVDFNQQRIEAGRQRVGVSSLYVGGVERLADLGRKADIVILHHVCEHFLELERELGRIRAVMNPGAHVYVALPGTFWWIRHNCGGDIMSLLQNAHTYQFSLDSLTYVMECAGFELIQGNEEIVALFRTTDRYRQKSEVPKGEFDRVIRHLRNLEWRYAPKRHVKQLAELFGVEEAIRELWRQCRS